MLQAIHTVSTRDKTGQMITFEPGEAIKGVSLKDKAELIECGAAVEIKTDQEVSKEK